MRYARNRIGVSRDDYFADPTRLVPSLDLLLENLDKDVEYCLHRVSFLLLSHFGVVVLVLIDYFIL
jgi:hypothetical protein